ncbi:MAG TPA: SBBP repeat-containing protein [Blastocatellia bacterium]|nr:SBBP repeat-containing protein [Blastocatellia bacterium]
MAAPTFRCPPCVKLKLAGLTASLLILASIIPPTSRSDQTPRVPERTPANSIDDTGLKARSRLARHGLRKLDRATRSRISEAYGKTALSFQANQGQAAPDVRFLARASGYDLFLTQTEAVLTLRIADGTRRNADSQLANYTPPDPQSAYIKIRLVGANPAPALNGLDPAPGASNYFIGARNWRTGIPSYRRVRYGDVYPGVDMIYYGNQRDLEYDFKVAPGADPALIKVSFGTKIGRAPVRVDADGDLIIDTAAGQIHQMKPFAYQEVEGAKKQIAARYVLRGSILSFSLGEHDKNKPLIIDPVLSYSTYLGSFGVDTGWAMAVDSAGAAYIAGQTNSTTFPTTQDALQKSLAGQSDVFVVKLNPAGTALDYSTYIGGSREDRGFGLALDATGAAYVTGETSSSNFPTKPQAPGPDFMRDFASAFVLKLNPAGNALIYSTYLGGLDTDTGNAIAVDSEGAAYVAGETSSRDFPLVNPFQSLPGNGFCARPFDDVVTFCSNAFVSKLNPEGTALVYSTYLGGSATDSGNGIAVDSEGAAYVTGETASTDFPTTPDAFQNQSGGTRTGGGFGGDAFVTKLSPSGSTLVYSTYLGRSGDEKGSGIAVDSEGNAYIAGTTNSLDFPTTAGSAQPSNGGSPAFKSATGGSSWSAIKNGLAEENVKTLAIDPVNPSTIYAGVAPTSPFISFQGGVFKSTDGGGSWSDASNGLSITSVNAIAIDPDTPSTIYAGTTDGVFKSTDGGGSWTRQSQGLTVSGVERIIVNALAIDPKRPSTIYAGTGFIAGAPDFRGLGGGVFKSTNGGATWGPTAFNEKPSSILVMSLAIDPRKSQMLYAGTTGGFFRGLKGGKKWKGPSLIEPPEPIIPTTAINSIAIDPNDRSTIYAVRGNVRPFSPTSGGVFKSTDRGKTWSISGNGLPASIGQAVAVDPRNSSIVYVGGYSTVISTFGNPRSGALFKSTNGGSTWSVTELSDVPINVIAVDPQNSSVYAGTFINSDAFITKLDPEGSKLLYSTYLGGRGADLGSAIALDSAGAAYVAGHTVSDRFPLVNAFQTSRGVAGILGTSFIGDAFVTKLNPSGSALVYSSYLGGNGIDEAFAIAVDSAGAAYVTGRNNSIDFPRVNPLQAALSGSVFDIFVTKVAPAESP